VAGQALGRAPLPLPGILEHPVVQGQAVAGEQPAAILAGVALGALPGRKLFEAVGGRRFQTQGQQRRPKSSRPQHESQNRRDQRSYRSLSHAGWDDHDLSILLS